MLNAVILSAVVLRVVLLSIIIMSVAMLSVIMLGDIMLRVIMLSVVMPSVLFFVMLIVIKLIVVATIRYPVYESFHGKMIVRISLGQFNKTFFFRKPVTMKRRNVRTLSLIVVTFTYLLVQML
jgi:hypothetical protein